MALLNFIDGHIPLAVLRVLGNSLYEQAGTVMQALPWLKPDSQ
jgi:hypothetical protein